MKRLAFAMALAGAAVAPAYAALDLESPGDGVGDLFLAVLDDRGFGETDRSFVWDTGLTTASDLTNATLALPDGLKTFFLDSEANGGTISWQVFGLLSDTESDRAVTEGLFYSRDGDTPSPFEGAAVQQEKNNLRSWLSAMINDGGANGFLTEDGFLIADSTEVSLFWSAPSHAGTDNNAATLMGVDATAGLGETMALVTTLIDPGKPYDDVFDFDTFETVPGSLNSPSLTSAVTGSPPLVITFDVDAEGAGTLGVAPIPVPAAAWLFAPAALMLTRMRKRA